MEEEYEEEGGEWGTALYDYEAEDEDELNMQAGDVIVELDQYHTDWWSGTNERTGETGTFPSNYVSKPGVEEEQVTGKVREEGGGGVGGGGEEAISCRAGS